MLARGLASACLLLAIVSLAGCAGSKTALSVEVGKDSCSGLSYIDESGVKSSQKTKEIPAGVLELNIVNSGDDRMLILVVAKELPTVMQYQGFTAGFQPVVNVDALTKDQLIATKSIPKMANAQITAKLEAGNYWLLDPAGISCADALTLNVVPD